MQVGQARARRSRRGAFVAAVALVGSVLATVSAGASPPGSTADVAGLRPSSSKIAAETRAALDQHGTADVWVRLDERADTSAARKIADRTERGQYVVDALKKTAAKSQADVRALLDARGLTYKAYWVTNAIRVSGASENAVLDLAGLDGVAEIRAPQVFEMPEPEDRQPADMAPNAVEWGVANINADDVWAEGVRGEGIVVANIDTGVQFDHPALVRQYRGNNGDGTFDHNYNWFDVSGHCDGAPCDTNGHGTHTMGTMAGDDGAGNQIGVAPAVEWIAANGCATCADADLIASSQWMLAPTDLAGENADVSKRPDIINNSWGTKVPSTEPFMEDIQRAWADSGIFAVWSNGNNGPSCGTSGSPGSRTQNYSVGAYDANNKIGSFSSRGPGQDGEVKPNIAAPGVNIRSSVPGSGYGLLSGTSMAAPHAAGAIALLWSGRPALVGDIDGTRAVLDVSAVDTADDQCGGTAEDNNVYGEGRLDALALLEIGAGGVGRLTGTVTASDTEAPVPNATVTLTGPVRRTVHTGTDGTYSITAEQGDYQLTVAGVFGYADATRPVTLAAGTTTQDVALDPLPTASVNGVVTDGSGRGGPLYAKVTADDGGGHVFTGFTDPVSGRYSLPVAPDTGYTLRVAAVYPGYTPYEGRLAVGSVAVSVDMALHVSVSCTAPGYRVDLDGTTEQFTRRPHAWSTDTADLDLPGYGDSKGWSFSNPGKRANETGGTGGFAIVDSDYYGQHEVQDTTLTGPIVDLSGSDSPAVVFATDLRPAVNATATVELSVDGGRSWSVVWRNAAFPGAPGPRTQVVPLPSAVGADHMQVRFHYTGQWSGWWQIDDVFLGNRTCTPDQGGLIVGEVTDPAGTGITGATVTTGQTSTTTVATPEDPALGDGFYWLPAPAGDHDVTATMPDHAPVTGTVAVHTSTATRLDLTLTT